MAQGAEMAFFAKNGHFSTFDRTSALCSMRIEVCCAFLQKKVFQNYFFCTFLFRFLMARPLPRASRLRRHTAGFALTPSGGPWSKRP